MAASYLLRPHGSACLSSGKAVDDKDDHDDHDRFADDGSVYIYREDDGSPSGNGPQEDGQGKTDSGGGFDYDRRNVFAPHGEDEEGRARRYEDGFRGWQDERRRDLPSARKGEVGGGSRRRWGGTGGELHGGVPVQQHPADGPVPIQRGGGGGDGAAGTSSNQHREEVTGGPAWRQRQQHALWPSGGADESSRTHAGLGGNARQANDGAGRRAPEPSAAAHGGRRTNRDSNSGGVSNLDDRGTLLDRSFGGETPTEGFVIPVPGASYSAKVDRGSQARGGRDPSIARGVGEVEGETLQEPRAKVRQVAVRLRSMILERQASANRSLREVFGHFDRRRCGYVNVAEMRDALADLRLILSSEEAKVGYDSCT